MALASLNIRLTYNQVLGLARQLSDEDKLLLNRELAADAKRIKLRRLAEAFRNDEILLSDIDSEVEQVRQERYEAGR